MLRQIGSLMQHGNATPISANWIEKTDVVCVLETAHIAAVKHLGQALLSHNCFSDIFGLWWQVSYCFEEDLFLIR